MMQLNGGKLSGRGGYSAVRLGLWFVFLAAAVGFLANVRGAPADEKAAEKSATEKPAAEATESNESQALLRLKQLLTSGAIAPKKKTDPNVPEQISILDLYFQGGILMIPITFMSILVVAFGLERWIGLRRGKVLPGKLVVKLRGLIQNGSPFDPREAWRVCGEFPSAAANVVRAVLLKVGRPYSEVDCTRTDSADREANLLYRNVRWLNLSASVTPLMGLLGTVQGMILAFFVTSHLPPGANRATQLAQGIYIALVTTFGGLVVAIPAAILAHYFEGRIQKLFAELEELLLDYLPFLERFEGKARASKDAAGELKLELTGAARPAAASASAPSVAARPLDEKPK